jgi:hypothetical protein
MGQVIHLSGVAFAACLLAGCAEGLRSTEAGLPDLSVHQWRHRVLVIDMPSPQDVAYHQQSAWLEAATAGLRERDLVIVTQPAAAFRIRLVGKDGGVKLDRAAPVEVPTLFSLIDAMPMRRAEMSSRR